jgi:predicted small lipoprotein YifL
MDGYCNVFQPKAFPNCSWLRDILQEARRLEIRPLISGFVLRIFPPSLKYKAVGGRIVHLPENGGFMKKVCGLFAGMMLVAMLTGCGGKAIDENKPADQVAADAAKMSQAELQKMVSKYEAAIAEKGKEIEALTAKVKEIPLTELMGDKAKTLKGDIGQVTTSLGKLKDQMAVYAKELAAKK